MHGTKPGRGAASSVKLGSPGTADAAGWLTQPRAGTVRSAAVSRKASPQPGLTKGLHLLHSGHESDEQAVQSSRLRAKVS